MGNIKLNLGALKTEPYKKDDNQKNNIGQNLENEKKDNFVDNSENSEIKKNDKEKNGKNDGENIKEEEKNKNTKKSPIKISISALKNKKEEKNENNVKKDENTNNNGVKLEEKILQKTENNEQNKINNNISIDIEKNNISNEEEQEFFKNYESDFSKEKESIKEKIKKAKNFVKPKTRLGFVFLLIGVTFFGIASLFIIAPEIHNLDNYKANLLKIKCKIEKKECKINKTINNKKEQIDKIKIQEKILNKYGITIKYKIKNENIYIYNNKEFSKIEWEKKLKNIFSELKRKKIKDFLQKNKENELKKYFQNKTSK